MEIDQNDLLYLLSLGNLFRARTSQKIMKSLPKGVPSESCECIIAKVFGNNSEVDPAPEGGVGFITFTSDEQAHIYMNLTGARPYMDGWSAMLTPLLNRIALKFDNGGFPELIDVYEMKKIEKGVNSA